MLIIRRATAYDADALAGLIDGFATRHPSKDHTRSVAVMSDAFFGSQPLAYALLAEKNGSAIGFVAWRKAFDMFWSVYGGEGIGLYVEPAHRGRGIAACLVAGMCAGIREQGGQYLVASYGAEWEALYERVAVGGAERCCHVSAAAFERLADGAGKSAREIVRRLPDKALNFAAAGTARSEF